MLVYKYDEKGLFVGAEETELDPLESELQGKDIYLLPPNATFDKPESKDGFAPVWDGEKWKNVEDHRGTKYWMPEDKHGSPAREMKELGALPDGALLTEPEPTFEELKERKLGDLSAKFNEAIYGSFTTSHGYVMQFSESDSLKLKGAIECMEANNEPEGYLVQADNTVVMNIPITTMREVYNEMLMQYRNIYNIKQVLRLKITEAETKEALNSIEIKFV